VRDVVTRRAEFVEASDSIERTARRMSEIDAKALLVRAGDHVGIVTKTDLADAVILRKIPIAAAVGPIAQYRVVSVDADDFVSMALLLMTKHCKRRVAVTREGVYVGILEDVDRAAGKDDLGLAAREIEGQTRILRRQGVRIEIVCEIVSDLNRRLFAKLFEILAPESIARKACLIVMGSEGRGEQSLRTDQDNGLILSEPIPETELAAFRMAFTAGLERFGFPPCPGDVMVRNPHWSKSLDDYRGDFRRWIALGDEAADMNIAIVYDAVAVAGDPELLAELKRDLIEAMSGEPLRLARFARAADAFPQPIGFFANWSSPKGQLDALDLKKSGIFPIVHGARSLAIEHRLTETGTAARIARLAEKGALTEDFARELIQALRYLMTLRLDGQIATAYAGDLAPRAALSSMDRDLLRDAFQIVKRFREMLRRHFHLNMF
jgi:CBS domain-containing protein